MAGDGGLSKKGLITIFENRGNREHGHIACARREFSKCESWIYIKSYPRYAGDDKTAECVELQCCRGEFHIEEIRIRAS